MSLIATNTTPPVFADADLSELGFEIFIDEPLENAKKEKAARKGTLNALPDFIDREAWEEDQRFDAPMAEQPKEPSWQGIHKQAETSAIKAADCCLQAARASRYQAESACLNMNKKVWRLLSVAPDEEKKADAKLGTCLLYKQTPIHQEEDSTSPGDIKKNQGSGKNKNSTNKISVIPEEVAAFEQSYRCVAKAIAQCYTPEVK